MTADLGPAAAARPVPSPEDRMRDARTDTPPTTDPAPTHPGRSFRTWMSDTDRDQLDARAAAAEQERDDALDDLRAARAEVALVSGNRDRIRKQLDDMTTTAASYLNERDEYREARDVAQQLAAFRQGVIDRHRQELGAAGEVLAVVRDAAERIDRALAVYDTTPGEPTTVNLGQHRRLRREAPNGCDHCSVEPGESHRYPGCPGATEPSSVPPRRAQEDDLADRLAAALAEVIGSFGERSGRYESTGWIPARRIDQWRGLLAEHADRAQEEPACTCYPSGFSPGTYEGPMRDCPVHGELSAKARP